jgi:AcrR family transcriptional regulator
MLLAFRMATSQRRKRVEPRKTPAQSRSTATVSAVLEAAARILERHGLEGYTTNAIAERAGVSIGSLYQYFPNKDAVTVALIERESAVLLAEVAAIDAELARTPAKAECEGALRRMIGAAVAHQMRRPKLARLLDFEEARLPIRPRIERVADLVLGLLVRILSRGKVIPAPEVEVAGLDVLAIVRGMVDAAGEREETDAVELERRVERAVFGYLGLRPQR